MVCAERAQLALGASDLAVEILDQLEARVDRPAPRLRDLQPIEQLAPSDAEQVGHRARLAERQQRRVYPVLQRGAVAHQVQPEARTLALGAHRRVWQPDRRHQLAA